MRLYDCRHGRSSMRSAAASLEQSSYGEHYLGDMLRSYTTERMHTRTLPSNTVNLVALVEDLKERQSTLVEISNTQATLTQEKLLELMGNHDRNIFKARSQFTHSTSTTNIPGLDANSNTNSATNTTTNALSSITTTTETGTGRTPTSTTDNTIANSTDKIVLPSAISTIPTITTTAKVGEATGSSTTGQRASVPTVSFQGTLTEEARKPVQAPLTKDQKLRAQLLSHSSAGHAAARMKQMQLQQQMTQMQGSSISSGSRVLSAVAQQQQQQQQQRAQQEDVSAVNNKLPETGRSNLASGKFVSPSKIPTNETERSEQGTGTVVVATGTGVAGEADQHDKSDIKTAANKSIEQKSNNTVKFHSSTATSTTNTTAKKYQRLSNRSFMGAKALAAMTSGGRPSPDLLSRTRNTNAAQQFAIIHGKIVPIHAGSDNEAKLKTEQYAQYIREYSQSHCVNPFRVRDSQSYSHSQSHNRRRWVHVFPQGE